MGQETTVKPLIDSDEPASELAHLDAEAKEASHVAAAIRVDDGAKPSNEAGQKTSAAASDDPSKDSALSSVAAAMTGDRDIFLQTLCRAVDEDISNARRRSLLRSANAASNEAALFDRLIAVAIDESNPSSAVTIGAALAARTVARSLRWTERDFALGDGEELLAAWLDAARAITDVRGPFGLRRLLPTARNLAGRIKGRGERVNEIAASIHRVAARIAADHAIGREVADDDADLRERDHALGDITEPGRPIVVPIQADPIFLTR